jgi:hypothetical protein
VFDERRFIVAGGTMKIDPARLTVRAVALCAVLAAGASPLAARAGKLECPAKGGPTWRELTTAHFVVQTNLGDKETRAAAARLERLRAALLRGISRAAIDPPIRVEVVIPREDYFDDVVGAARVQLFGWFDARAFGPQMVARAKTFFAWGSEPITYDLEQADLYATGWAVTHFLSNREPARLLTAPRAPPLRDAPRSGTEEAVRGGEGARRGGACGVAATQPGQRRGAVGAEGEGPRTAGRRDVSGRLARLTLLADALRGGEGREIDDATWGELIAAHDKATQLAPGTAACRTPTPGRCSSAATRFQRCRSRRAPYGRRRGSRRRDP